MGLSAIHIIQKMGRKRHIETKAQVSIHLSILPDIVIVAVDFRRKSIGYLRHFGGIQFLRTAEAEHASTRSHSTRFGKQINGVSN